MAVTAAIVYSRADQIAPAHLVDEEGSCRWELDRGVVITSPRDAGGKCSFDNLIALLKADEGQ
jgi:hypothetical protein